MSSIKSDRKLNKTIGFLTRSVSDEFGLPIWNSIAKTAKKMKFNLITFTGGALNSPLGFEAQGNIIYKLIDEKNIDGLIIWSGILSHYVGQSEIEKFCKQFSSVPVVSIEIAIKGIPSILGDFYSGVHSLVTHLIKDHGYRNIGFICGPEDSETGRERYQAYADVLKENKIETNPDLILPGTFFAPSGKNAINILLNDRKIDIKNIDAIVAANDNMAIDAMKELQNQNINVPSDIAVVGIDDINESRCLFPPLTSVKLPMNDWGEAGVQLLDQIFKGEKVATLVKMPMKLIVRQSCGCPSSAVKHAINYSKNKKNQTSELETFPLHKENILQAMIQSIEASLALDQKTLRKLLDSISIEIDHKRENIFLKVFEKLLYQLISEEAELIHLNKLLTVLEQDLIPLLNETEKKLKAENLIHQARILLGEIAQRFQAYIRIQEEFKSNTLINIAEALTTSFNLDEIGKIIVNELPKLGIKKCYISLYETDKEKLSAFSKLIIGYDKNGSIQIDNSKRIYQSNYLIPLSLKKKLRSFNFVVLPLYFKKEQIGFAILEYDSKEFIACDALRSLISSGLKGGLLSQEREELTKEIMIKKESLEIAKRETDTILKNVNEGLFLLDENHIIGSQYSSELENLLNDSNISHRNLFDLLQRKINESDINNCKEYLDILYKESVDISVIDELNPMNEIKFSFNNKNDKSDVIKYLNFVFKKIKSFRGNHDDIFVKVKDITKEVILAEELKKTQAKTNRQIKMILGFLHIDPIMLHDFIDSTNNELKFIRDSFHKNDNAKNALNKIFRSTHLIKGNANLLQLDYIVDIVHEYEDKIKALKDKSNITKKDMNKLENDLHEIRFIFDEMSTSIERMGKIYSQVKSNQENKMDKVVKSLINLVNEICNDLNKQVNFVYDKFNMNTIPGKYIILIKDILIQLVRNSLVHGIESKEERRKLNKPESGKIEINSFDQNNSFCIKFKDDGRGIQINKLKHIAIKSGKYNPDVVEKWSKKKLLNTIFIPGISTADTLSTSAGRGVGMGLIKEKVDSYNGKIEIDTSEGEFCEFSIILPK